MKRASIMYFSMFFITWEYAAEFVDALVKAQGQWILNFITVIGNEVRINPGAIQEVYAFHATYLY